MGTGAETAAERKKTVKEVLDAAATSRLDIHTKMQALGDRVEAIKDHGYDRELTDDERAEIKEIGTAQMALSETERELALMTARALNETAEVARLANVLTAATKNLDDSLKQVQRVAKQVKKLGDLFKTLEKVVTGLAKIAAMVL